jgi:enamine deaminase RidA (YjgF/YER057c/UK114 family)
MGRIARRLRELGLDLPAAQPPIATYVPFALSGSLVVVSGQLPMHEGRLLAAGKLGASVTVEQGQRAARQCLLNVLAHLSRACEGDLDRVARVVRLGGFIACTPDFTEHAKVMNGASDLVVEIFGEAGRHARATVGVPSLPNDAAVEIEALFEIDVPA